MKTKTKKLVFGLGLALSGYFAQAQGIDGIIVEKYYIANAADVANANTNGATVPLTANSVTYRVYVDMAAGWKFSLLKGNSFHNLKFNTTTAFYNDPNNGVVVGAQATSLLNEKKNTVRIDSWLTTGGTAVGKVGVIESQDADGSLGNSQSILANNPGGVYGAPINGAGAADGMISGTTVAPTVLGFGTATDIFDQTPGGNFLVNNGAMSALGGALGYGPNNTMLLGQFTTDGVFTFELNIQLINPVGTAVEYVASTPQAGETVYPGLTLLPPAPPVVVIGGPSNLITGNVGTYTATATDVGGTVTAVQFQVDGVNSGAAITGSVAATYSLNYTGVTGTHTISLVATDNDLLTGTASKVVNVAANQAPTSTVAVASNTYIVGDVVTFTVSSSDVDGTVVSKFAEIDGVSTGTTAGAVSTYTALATLGTHAVRAKATDNLGLTNPAYSAIVNYTVSANIPPTAVIVTPANGASYLAPAVASVSATATDADGTVSNVVFLVNGVPTQTATVAPYTFAYTTSTLAVGAIVLTVRSTDNKGAVTLSSPVTINVSDPNALPYAVVNTTATCLPTIFCLPVAAASTYSVNDVIGYDFTLNYDITKVSPTGTITIYNNLINPSYVEVASFNDAINGKLNISLYLNAAAPSLTEFNGSGNLICVEFTKLAGFASGVDNALFSISNLEESYITGVQPKLASNGKFSTSKDTAFNASLRFWSNNEPIRYDVASPSTYLKTNIYGASAACVTNTLVSVQTNTLGNFTHNLVNGQSINIDRDIINTTNVITVVNSQDAFIGKRITLSIPSQTLSVFQALALDVNLDGKISAGDVSQIQQRLALIIGEFKQAWNYSAAGVSNGSPSKDWVFVDSLRLQNNLAYRVSATFPGDDGIGFSKSRVPVTPFCLPATVTNYSVCPLVTPETYKGVMVGDADGSYALLLPNGSIKRTSNSTDKVIFDLSNATVSGNTVDVPVSFESATEVHAIDFNLNFDETKLSLNTVLDNIVDSDMSSVYHLNTNDRTLRYGAYTLNQFEAKKPIASVRFNAENGEIAADDLTGVIGLLNGKMVDVTFVGSINKQVINNNISIYPNPTSGLLNVLTSENSTVQLMDLTGKEVLLQTTLNAYEKQEINVSNFANGVYMMKIFNNNSVTVKKIVLNK